MGAELPEELREYLRTLGHASIGTNQLFGLGVKPASAYGIVERYRSDIEHARPTSAGMAVPIADLGNGDLFVIDVDSGEVWLHAHELDEWDRVAKSMSAWTGKVLKRKGLGLLGDVGGGG